jgi:glucose/arabinose dehydrogenase
MMKLFHFLLPVVMLLVNPAIAVPTGFIDEGVVAINAIKGAFAPNPRLKGKPMLLLSSKEGAVHVLEDPDNSDIKSKVADLSTIICANGPRGLLSILPHPDFLSNRYIFMYYTRIVPDCPEDAINGPTNRLSRFTMNASTLQIELSTEMVLLETPPSPVALHIGGAMTIGNDGLLYLAIGDGGKLNYAQDLRNLYGKLVRLDMNGKVPSSNPYTVPTSSGRTGVSCRKSKGQPPSNSSLNAVCEEIYAYGLRNPFRLGLDMNTKDKVRFAIADVGLALWEEISYGGTEYKGTNYGWADVEGPCKKSTINDCPQLGTGVTEPFYYYQHGAIGGAVTGSAFVPTGLWPAKYKYLFIDFIFGTIYNLVADSGRACRTCTPPIPAFRNETFHKHTKMVDMFFGPYKDTQAMYIVARSSGQNVRRIRYTGNTNRAPEAKIFTTKKGAIVNEVIPFIGSNSSDPDGDTLIFLWNFGDGRTSTEVNPLLSYARQGEYQVTLTVTDTVGQKSQAFVTIVVGTPPVAVLELPAYGSQFEVGQRLRLKGRAKDSNNRPIPDAQIFWEVRLRHATHYHPFLDKIAGNNFDLYPAPSPEDFIAAPNSFLQIIMYAVDSDGITKTIQRNVRPKIVLIDMDSNPRGLQVLVDELAVVTPSTITSWQNHTLVLNVNDQGSNIFSSWSIVGSRMTKFTVPAVANSTHPKITANFRSMSPRAAVPVSVPIKKIPTVLATTTSIVAPSPSPRTKSNIFGK